MGAETQDWTARRKRNKRSLLTWTFAWLLSLAVASFGPILVWEGNKAVSIIAIALNLAFGAGMILANKRHLKSLDEMHQRVQLEAMGITLGVGLVAGLGYSVLDVADVIGAHAEISHLVMLLGLTYSLAVTTGLRRMR